MIADEEIDALRAIADRVMHEAEQVGYGYFPGGDPREFSPDHESCTDEEIERHKADCEAWDRGEQIDRGPPMVPIQSGDKPPEGFASAMVRPDGSGHAHVAHYGIGSYTYRDEFLTQLAQDLDDWIDRVRQVSR